MLSNVHRKMMDVLEYFAFTYLKAVYSCGITLSIFSYSCSTQCQNP